MKHQMSAAQSFIVAAVGSVVLLATSVPALAASGLTICDKAARNKALEVSPAELKAYVVDHGEASAAPQPDATQSGNIDAEVIRDILDAKAAAGVEHKVLKTSSGSAPVAEATQAPNSQEELDERRQEQQGSETVPGVSTRLPGVSEDDAIRFRSEMYRTDI